jgi:hypothetical protein
MKRLVWLLLTVFGAAIAQVPPVDGLVLNARPRCCCKIPGACGMPGCCPQPVSNAGAVTAAPVARAIQAPARRCERAVRRIGDKFYLSCVAPVAVGPGRLAAARSPRPVPAPLFRAHCSLLI